MKPALAVLFLTHRWQPVDAARFTRLQGEVAPHADCYLVMDDRTRYPARDTLPVADERLFLFNAAALPGQLGYPFLTPKGLVPGCVHYVHYAFALRHPYERYLIVEHDVEYTGDWSMIARHCNDSDADLLAAHVHNHAQRPDWFWWRSLRDPLGRPPPQQRLWKAFFPLACISHRALRFVHEAQRSGWSGHFEVLIPSLLNANGLRVRDWNEGQARYLGSEQNPQPPERLSALSTLRWRPEVDRAEFLQRWQAQHLYHPVKAPWAWRDGVLSEFAPDWPA